MSVRQAGVDSSIGKGSECPREEEGSSSTIGALAGALPAGFLRVVVADIVTSIVGGDKRCGCVLNLTVKEERLYSAIKEEQMGGGCCSDRTSVGNSTRNAERSP